MSNTKTYHALSMIQQIELQQENERLRAELAAKIPEGMTPIPDADWLSNVIRKVDGNHNLGAGQLAEKIVDEMIKSAAKE